MPFPGIITVPVAPYTGGSNNEGSDYDKGSTDPLTGNINDDLRDGFIQDIVTDPSSGEQVTIEHDSDKDEIINQALNGVGSSAKDASAVDSLLSMYKTTGDEAWLEKYLDTLIARENTESARAYETEMSNTSFSRMINDIKASGYNPWLALQSSQTASTPNVSAAGQSGISYSSQQNQKSIQQNQATAELISRIISSVGVAAAVIISKLILKA